jgi:hypothetical protein
MGPEISPVEGSIIPSLLIDIGIERHARLEKERKSLDIIYDRFVIGVIFSAK